MPTTVCTFEMFGCEEHAVKLVESRGELVDGKRRGNREILIHWDSGSLDTYPAFPQISRIHVAN